MEQKNHSIIFYQNEADAFMRIAEAQLRPKYRFGPQRRAVAAKMLMKWMERKASQGKISDNNENFFASISIIQ